MLSTAPTDVRYLQKAVLGALQASYFNGRLTIGTGLTIRGGSGTVGNSPSITYLHNPPHLLAHVR